jgi:23S rRNA-/tRNA-specific pseudouridylate synthase
LVNRLDNDTSGLLYFAKTPTIKENYLHLQSVWKTQKTYISDVSWNLEIKYKNKPFVITSPIAHHRFETDRMVVLHNDFWTIPTEILLAKYKNKIKWKLHEVKTKVTPLRYDQNTNSTTCSITISKWIRHQIRAHLSSIGAPILGEKVYTKKILSKKLHLWSVWLKI